MQDLNQHGHYSTDTVTNIADKLGLRPAMLSSAFRDGMFNNHTYVNAPSAAEAGSIVTFIATVTAVIIEGTNTHELKPEKIFAYGFAAIFIASVGFISNRFKEKAKEDAEKIDHYFKKEYEAVHTILGQNAIWREMDAHILGRGMSYLSHYLKRNMHALQFERNFGKIVEHDTVPAPSISKDKRQKMGDLQEASDVTDENELRDDIIRAYAMLRHCEDLALSEKVMKPQSAVCLHYRHRIRAPIDNSMKQLGLMEHGENVYECHKYSAERPEPKVAAASEPRA